MYLLTALMGILVIIPVLIVVNVWTVNLRMIIIAKCAANKNIFVYLILKDALCADMSVLLVSILRIISVLLYMKQMKGIN